MKNWVTLITFTYPHEAHMVKSLLESEGITVFMKDELTAQVNNFYSNAIGGVKLQIPEEESEKALDILKQTGYIKEVKENEVGVTEEYAAKYANICPYCNSQNVSRQKKPGYITLLSYFLLGAILPFLKKSYHCFDCEKEWIINKNK